MDPPISSTTNPTVKLVRSLQRREGRDLERAFILEGRRAVADAVAAGIAPTLVLADEAVGAEQVAFLPAPVPVRRVASRLFASLADTQHPQGVLAVVPIPKIDPPSTETPLTLIVDGVRDPGNLGTLLRSAAAAGADRAVLLPTSVDAFNPKVVRAGMGAHVRLSITWADAESAQHLAGAREVVALLTADGGAAIDEVDWTRPAAIVVGGEAFGPSALGESLATVRTRIPLTGGIESLNAGVAGSITLFEASRQRRARPGRSDYVTQAASTPG